MNFYSAKEGDNDYIMVDDYDCGIYDVWSEIPIILLENDRLLCKRDEKYGVVNAEGWTVIPLFMTDLITEKNLKMIDIVFY